VNDKRRVIYCLGIGLSYLMLVGCASTKPVVSGDLIETQTALVQAVDTVVNTGTQVSDQATIIADKYKDDELVQAHKETTERLVKELNELRIANDAAIKEAANLASLSGKLQGELYKERINHAKTRGQRNALVIALAGVVAFVLTWAAHRVNPCPMTPMINQLIPTGKINTR